MIFSSPLPDRAVFAVSGEHAATFLQGLITNDIRKTTEGHAIFAALLSPQGRFLFDFFIIAHEGKFLFDTDKERLPDLLKRLAMYRLRSQVSIEEWPEWSVSAVWGEGEEPAARGEVCYKDPRLPELGLRILSGIDSRLRGNNEADYDAHRIALGVPDGAKDLIIERSLPLEYGYDELRAIDFNKGCYVGQEVTARTKHRATLRKFIHQVQADMPLPARGTIVMAGEREAGLMGGNAGNIGLALLRIEEAGGPLTAGAAALKANLPSWCNTSFAIAEK